MKLLNQIEALQGTDQVIAVIPVPEGGSIESIRFTLTAIAQDKQDVLLEMCGYALSAYMFPILDPDTAWVANTVWDQQLPKDDQFAASDLDLDTTGTDTTPDLDWGDANPSLLAGAAGFPTPLYKASRMISFANSKGGFEVDGHSAGFDGFIPTDIWSRNINRSKSAPVHSAVMIGMSSYIYPTPLAANAFVMPASDLDWDILKYADDYQNDARKSLVGGIATGTQEVATEALAFINSILESNLEEDAGAFHPQNWRFFIEGSATVLVPGQFNTPALDSGQPLS